MSRAQLVAAAKRVGVAVTLHVQGRSGPKHTDVLRVDLLHRCYGPNLGKVGTGLTAQQLDDLITRAVDCARGNLGYSLGVSQACIRDARTELAEYRRLCGLKRRRPADEARLLRSAQHWLEIAHIAQELHQIETGIRNREVR